MTRLQIWLDEATCHLSHDSASRVRAEIRAHYEMDHENALRLGANRDEADLTAINALGSAKAANREYRKVLLTSAEARMLRVGNSEARAFCRNSWLRYALFALPVTLLSAAAWRYSLGSFEQAKALFMGALGIALLFAVPFLPVYTPLRGRVWRILKCVGVTVAVIALFGRDALNWSWLICSSLWVFFYTEWTRASIRRKLPVAEWPKHLYL